MALKDDKKEAKIVKPAKREYEATYTVEELVQAAADFGASRILVRAALTKAGKDSYTMKEAKQLIERMKNKEVRA